ncbi:MAG: efflux RND transporter permease subunit, partial [Chloroflexi bacterium]|nr:efflux RND transporter permease subunit [Chloroflexota bacterium]
FGSWLAPLAVLASLPMALAGAVLALWATENTINVFSMIGMVALMGLMAKNAILLTDSARDLQRRGMALPDALRAAGQERLRPILMTTATVVLAMAPLALQLETGGESRAPMAVAVIGGSLSSTLLTLLLAPVLLSYLDQLRNAWLAWRPLSGRAAATVSVAPDAPTSGMGIPVSAAIAAVSDAPPRPSLAERLTWAAPLAARLRQLTARPERTAEPEVRTVRKLARRSAPQGWVGTLWRIAHFFQAKPLAAFGALIILTLVFTAVFADYVAPYALDDFSIREARLPPSPLHPLGTDAIGRDNLSKLVYGSQIALMVGPVTVVLGTAFAVLVGLFTGYRGGYVDMVFNRFMDAWMTFPDLIIVISAVAILGPDVTSVMIMIGFIYAVGAARVIRSAVVSVRNQPYIEAAQTLGASQMRMMFMHVLPNIIGPVMVTASLGVGQALMMEAMVTYLGLGLPGAQPSWAGMIRANRLLALWPGLCIAATIFAFNVIADALVDYTGPRSRVFEPEEERELRLPRRRPVEAAASDSGASGGGS